LDGFPDLDKTFANVIQKGNEIFAEKQNQKKLNEGMGGESEKKPPHRKERFCSSGSSSSACERKVQEAKARTNLFWTLNDRWCLEEA